MAGSRTRLTGDDLAARAAALPGWQLANDRLSKQFAFPDFAQALAFVNRVGAVAEEMGHHPDIQLGWGRAAIETWTHDAHGITALDFELARKIDGALK
jgi:4a-hydroxytetrahydrobiopterin dehydratase